MMAQAIMRNTNSRMASAMAAIFSALLAPPASHHTLRSHTYITITELVHDSSFERRCWLCTRSDTHQQEKEERDDLRLVRRWLVTLNLVSSPVKELENY